MRDLLQHVVYAGLDAWTPVEGDVIAALGLRRAGADALAGSSAPVSEWIAGAGITHLAVHFENGLTSSTLGPEDDAPRAYCRTH